LVIRHATPADIPAILDLAHRAVRAAHWPVEQYQRIFANETPRRVALVSDEQSSVQAFLVGRVLNDEWELENIVVSDLLRQQGLGKRLLDEFLGAAKTEGAKTAFLEVRESNAAARRLYEKSGFVENGRRQRYYTAPAEDAILYHKFLT
jgi:ribosomal-protein-alanine N-acetyltransferase